MIYFPLFGIPLYIAAFVLDIGLTSHHNPLWNLDVVKIQSRVEEVEDQHLFNITWRKALIASVKLIAAIYLWPIGLGLWLYQWYKETTVMFYILDATNAKLDKLEAEARQLPIRRRARQFEGPMRKKSTRK